MTARVSPRIALTDRCKATKRDEPTDHYEIPGEGTVYVEREFHRTREIRVCTEVPVAIHLTLFVWHPHAVPTHSANRVRGRAQLKRDIAGTPPVPFRRPLFAQARKPRHGAPLIKLLVHAC